MKFFFFGIVALLSTVDAQLAPSSYHIGPQTSRATKAATKTCNVLNYGAKADKSTDIGPPLTSAFAACKSGGNGRHFF
jgi:rhamnogalacturonan hydrolase